MMHHDRVHALNPLVSSLLVRDRLTPEEIEAVFALPFQVKTFTRDQTMVREMEQLHFSCVLLDGVAGRAIYADKGRQLTAIHVAGDWIDLHGFLLKKLDHNIVALSPCSIALISHRALIGISEEFPHLTRVLWLSTLVDAAIHRQQLTNIGRRNPIEAMVHLACEIYVRRKSVGLDAGPTFPLPLTQNDLADLFGLSLVHISRTLRELRALPFIQWGQGIVTLTSFDEAAAFAGFSPDYLNLFEQPR